MSELDQDLVEAPYEAPVSPVAAGELVQGKYRVGPLVGYGGMAAVVAGHHLELDHPVAIKFLLPEHAMRPDAVRRFLAEARAAARLKSPHVARVLDVGTTEASTGTIVPFMVMELLKGRDLDGVLQQRGRLPVGEAVEYVLQACDAVAEAHALGIIHRDLKPGNLFLTTHRDRTAVIKLLDFGISKIAARGAAKNAAAVTADREMMGSPGYMSPEQIRSSKEVDPRTDVWSLGIILHELLTGHAPFEAENVADTLVRILHSAPDALAKRAPDVPEELTEIILRCLQKKPEGRFASVEAFAAALAPFRSTTPIVVPEDAERAEDPPMAESGVSVRTVHELPKRRIFLTSALAFGAVGLVLIAVVVVARLRHTPATAASPTTDEPSASPPPAAEPPPVASAAAAAAVVPTTTQAVEETPAPTASTTLAAPPKAKATNAKPPPPAAKPPASATAGARHRTDW